MKLAILIMANPVEVVPMRFPAYYQRMASAGKGKYLFPTSPQM